MRDWKKAAELSDLPPGTAQAVQCEGRSIALYNVEGRIYATDNACPHQGGPLGEGDLSKTVITCPWHQWQFDVTTGGRVSTPGISVRTYEIRLENGNVMIKFPD